MTLSAWYIPCKKEYPSRSAKSPQPGPSDRVVFRAQDVRGSFRSVWSSSSRLICYESEHKAAVVHVTGSGSHGMEAGLFSAFMGLSERLCLFPLCFHSAGLANFWF